MVAKLLDAVGLLLFNLWMVGEVLRENPKAKKKSEGFIVRKGQKDRWGWNLVGRREGKKS